MTVALLCAESSFCCITATTVFHAQQRCLSIKVGGQGRPERIVNIMCAASN
jgi:hypothetical protein